jgi:hypothetical protein
MSGSDPRSLQSAFSGSSVKSYEIVRVGQAELEVEVEEVDVCEPEVVDEGSGLSPGGGGPPVGRIKGSVQGPVQPGG